MTTENSTANAGHLSDDDLVLFALQLLPEERMRHAMSHVQDCAQCRSEIAKIQGDLAAYSTTAEPQAPPPSARDRFTRQIAREPRPAELPPFELKATEFELQEQAREKIREQERQKELAQQRERELEQQRQKELALQREKELEQQRQMELAQQHEKELEQQRQRDIDQRRQREVDEQREKERLAQMSRPEPPLPVEQRAKEPAADQKQSVAEKRVKDIAQERDRDDRLSSRSEPVFSARQSRSFRSDSTEGDEPALPGQKSSEPVFATRQSRNLRTEKFEEEDEAPSEERSRPRRAPWVLAWTGWAIAAGCSFVAGLQFHQRQQMQGTLATQQARLDDMQKQTAHVQEAQTALATLTSVNAMQVALRPTSSVKLPAAVKGVPAPATPEALAAYLADKGALVFVAVHMQPAPAGKTYELWLLPANNQAPIPAGTFKPDARGGASVMMPHLPAGVPAKGFGVTVENDGGSSTPTLPIVMS